MTAHLIRGDARQIPLKDRSVQVVICSPPYFGLRQYSTNPVIWGGDPDCSHQLEDGPVLKPMTGGTGATSKKQVTNAGSQFGNAWVENPGQRVVGRLDDKGANLERRAAQHGSGTAKATGERYAGHGATCTRCSAWRGELGSEPHVAMFVEHLVEVFRECKRVMRDDGICFINIGDGYSGSGKGPTGHNGIGNQARRQGFKDQPSAGRAKSLQLVPERLAIALSDDGWIVRQVLIWSKNNPMPESVTDRWTTAHEYILMLVKQPRYFFDQEAIREPHADDWHARASTWRNGDAKQQQRGETYHGFTDASPPFANSPNPAGRNGRSVWSFSTAQYPGAHYAVFNEEIPRRCILAATSDYGACTACGAPWRRVVERGKLVKVNQDCGNTRPHAKGKDHQGVLTSSSGRTKNGIVPGHAYEKTTTGWGPTCTHTGAGVRPCIVLDPFSGSGTTAFVAAQLGRTGIGVELSAEYIQQARYGRLKMDFMPLGPAPAPIAATPAEPPPPSLFDLFDDAPAHGAEAG